MTTDTQPYKKDDYPGDTEGHSLWNKEPVYIKRVRVHLDDGTDHRATKITWDDERPAKYLDDEAYESHYLTGLGFTLIPVPCTVQEMSGWQKALSEGNPSLPHRDITKHVRLEMILW